MFEGKPFVVAVNPGSEAASRGVRVGSEILETDGLAFESKLARLRPLLPACSSERAFAREACRHLLDGEAGSTVTLKLHPPEGSSQVFTLKRSFPWASPPPPVCPIALTRQRFVEYGLHPSGWGYIRISSFLGRNELDEEFDRALEAVGRAPGLILDIRDNPGGFGHPHIVGRFIQERTLGAICCEKNGPGHRDLKRIEDVLVPTGPCQYGAPVALLVNDITGSAADLFACYLRSARRVVTIGSTTHGNLSGVAAYAVMPCGLVVRISNGYICDASGNPIEGRGNPPDITVNPTIADFLAGKDPVLEKAAAVLSQKSAQGATQ
jgi:carboxyl-terminal processing protease